MAVSQNVYLPYTEVLEEDREGERKKARWEGGR